MADLSLHNLEWTNKEEVKGDVCSAKHVSQDEVTLLLKHEKHLEKQIKMLTSLHALEEKQGVTRGPFLIKPIISKEEVHSPKLGSHFPRSSMESIMETFMIGQAKITVM